jgi:hypothetical protein
MKYQTHKLRGQLFSSTQIPVCLEFLAKNKHDGLVAEDHAEDQIAPTIIKFNLHGVEATDVCDSAILTNPIMAARTLKVA